MHSNVPTPAQSAFGAIRPVQGGVELRLQIVGHAQTEFEGPAHRRVGVGRIGEGQVVAERRRHAFGTERLAPVQAQHSSNEALVDVEIERVAGIRLRSGCDGSAVCAPGLGEATCGHLDDAARERETWMRSGNVGCQQLVCGLQASDALGQPQAHCASILENSSRQFGRFGLGGVAHGRHRLPAPGECFGDLALQRPEPPGSLLQTSFAAMFPDQRVQPPSVGTVHANRFEKSGKGGHGFNAPDQVVSLEHLVEQTAVDSSEQPDVQ